MIGRARALFLYLAMSVPFGILVHLGAEFAALGRNDHVAFSALHAYLGLLAAGSAGAFIAGAGFFSGSLERKRRISQLAHSLPWGGRGAKFVAFSAMLQFGFFALTQLGEGCPFCNGDVFVGIVAALVASIAGAILLDRLRLRIVRIIEALSTYLDAGDDAKRLHRRSRPEAAPLRPPLARYALAIANRPPPSRPF